MKVKLIKVSSAAILLGALRITVPYMKKVEVANSLGPDVEPPHGGSVLSHLIWIYPVCHLVLNSVLYTCSSEGTFF